MTNITTISVPPYRQRIYDQLLSLDYSKVGLSGMLAQAAQTYINMGNTPVLQINIDLVQEAVKNIQPEDFIKWQKTLKMLNDITQMEAKRRL